MSRVLELLNAEENQQENKINLMASENFIDPDIAAVLGSAFANKYVEGYPNERESGITGRTYEAYENYDELEEYCCAKWKEVFGTNYHANVQPFLASQANSAVYHAMLEDNDIVLIPGIVSQDHIIPQIPLEGLERYKIYYYLIGDNGLINLDDLHNQILAYYPKLIVIGASNYPRMFDFQEIKDTIDGAVAQARNQERYLPKEPFIMVDMAHIAGFVATGHHESPFGWADFITITTNKTMRGPRSGIIFCKPTYAKQIDIAVNPNSQSGTAMDLIAAKAICAEKVLNDDFNTYMDRVLVNSVTMAQTFMNLGYKLVGNGSDTHMIILDLSEKNITGKELQKACYENNIILNKTFVPNDKKSDCSGVRIGVIPMTTKGYTSVDFTNLANTIHNIIEIIVQEREPFSRYDMDSIHIGNYPLDPNTYRDIEMWKNVTVIVSENTDTGEISLSWKKQDNSEDISDEIE